MAVTRRCSGAPSSAVLYGMSQTSDLAVGWGITAPNNTNGMPMIRPGTIIASIDSSSQVTMSQTTYADTFWDGGQPPGTYAITFTQLGPTPIDTADTVGLADATTWDIGSLLADTLALADAFDLGGSFTVNDTAVLVDLFGIDHVLNLADVIGFGGLYPSNSILPSGTIYPNAGDQLVIGTGFAYDITPTDSLTLTDDGIASWVWDYGLDLADTMALADSLGQQSDYDLQLADAVTLLDGVTLDLPGALSLDLVDGLVLSDSAVSFAQGHVLDLADATTLDDSLSSAQDFGIGLVDTIALADILVAGFVVILDMADVVALADELVNVWDHVWLIPLPPDGEVLTPVTDFVLALTPVAGDTPALVPIGGDAPSATPLPDDDLVLTPFAEVEH